MNKMSDLELAKLIANKVNEHGGKAYFVGGYVRDKLLYKENKDIDIEVHNIEPKKLREILSDLGEVKIQGASFGILNIKGYDVDIAQPRKERNNGSGHKDFDVDIDPFIGIEEAARRRDFTINALMEDILTGEIIDPFNGLDDLDNGIIRHIDDTTFVEDPLRVLRAAQFCARFNFELALETKDLIKTMDISNLSSERIFGELSKALLKSNNPSIFFNVLRSVNQLDVWFPEVKALIDCPQPKKWHPEGDVWNHTMLVLDIAARLKKDTSNPLYFMMAALCHDFGKPLVVECINGKITTRQHDIVGVKPAITFLNRITTEVAIKNYVTNMIKLHMKPNMYAADNARVKATNKLFDDALVPIDLILLSNADHFGRANIESCKWDAEEYLYTRLDIYNKLMTEPEVTGKDLIKLGYKPSPIFSEILEKAHLLHLCGVSKDSALKQLKGLYKLEV